MRLSFDQDNSLKTFFFDQKLYNINMYELVISTRNGTRHTESATEFLV